MNKSDFSLEDANIAIIGLGLMGGSIALSLKEQCCHLSALDIHLSTLELAQELEIVHTASSNPVELLANDIVSVQAMNMPIGKLFFFVPQTSSRVDAANDPTFLGELIAA